MSVDVEYIKKSGRLYWKANEVLQYKISVPRTGNETVNGFYLKIAACCEKFCTDILYPKLCEKGGRYRYEMVCTVTHYDRELISVVMRARLMLGVNLIQKYLDAQNWEAQGEDMYLHKQVKFRFGDGKRGCKRGEKFFVYGGRAQNLTEMDEILIFG